MLRRKQDVRVDLWDFTTVMVLRSHFYRSEWETAPPITACSGLHIVCRRVLCKHIQSCCFTTPDSADHFPSFPCKVKLLGRTGEPLG